MRCKRREVGQHKCGALLEHGGFVRAGSLEPVHSPPQFPIMVADRRARCQATRNILRMGQPVLVNSMDRVQLVLVSLLPLIMATRLQLASWAFLSCPPCGLLSPTKGRTITPHFRPRDSNNTPSLPEHAHVSSGVGVGGQFRTKKGATTSVRQLQGGGKAGAEDGDDGREACNVIVTGANRGLGLAIAERMVLLGHKTVLACRSKNEGDAALARIRSRSLAGDPAGRTDGAGKISSSVYQLDVTCPKSIHHFRKNCVERYLDGRVDILFNNAGVCLEGTGGGVLNSTLAVNFFGALDVMEACLPAMRRDPTGNHEERSGATVVWVSSGDGELCFLGSKWQMILSETCSLEEVKRHLTNMKASVNTTPPEEIAFGPTPAYSLSKAAANAAVRTLAPTLQTPEEGGVRLVAVCPGDVLTRMCSVPEDGGGVGGGDRAGGAVSPEEAAPAVIDVALRPSDFPGGRFYRAGREIKW